MAELTDVIQQLKENNESTIDTTQAVDSLANQIGRMYAQDAAKELEASREKAKVVAQTTTEKGGSGGSGEIGFAGRLGKLGGLGLLAAGLGKFAKGAGIGLAGFFLGIAGAEAILERFSQGSKGENLKNLMINLAEGLAAFTLPALRNLGLLFAGGALFGVVRGLKNPFKLPGLKEAGDVLGMTAIGLGLGGFLSGLAVSDKAIGFLKTDGSNLGNFLKNIGTGLSEFSKNDYSGFKDLFKDGAIFGAVTGGAVAALTRLPLLKGIVGGAAGGAILGIVAVAGGLGLFVTALAGIDFGAAAIGADGAAFKTLAQNLVAGMLAFGNAGLTDLIKDGAIFGAVLGGIAAIPGGKLISGAIAGGAIVGIGLIAAGIATFIGTLAGAEKGLKFIKADGSGFKTFAKGITESIGYFKDLPVGIGDEIGKIGVGFAKLFGASGLGVLAKIGKGLSDLFSKFFKGDETSFIQKLVNDVKVIEPLSDSTINKFSKLADAFAKLGDGIRSLKGTTRDLKNFKANIVEALEGYAILGKAINAMIVGGKVEIDPMKVISTTGKGKIKQDVPAKTIDFSPGLQNARTEDLYELLTKAKRALSVLGPPSLQGRNLQPSVEGGGGGSSAIVTGNNNTNTTNNNSSAVLGGSSVIDLNDQMLLNVP